MPARRKRPGKIVCVGRNYREHAKELGNEVPKEPLIFLKPPSSVVWDAEAILLPGASSKVEYEGEIGVVIGKAMTRVSESDAARGIRGIVAVNDVTARDLQKTDSQWTRAKGFDTFCPLGEESSKLPGPRQFERRHASERRRAPAGVEQRNGLLDPVPPRLHLANHDVGARRPRGNRNALGRWSPRRRRRWSR